MSEFTTVELIAIEDRAVQLLALDRARHPRMPSIKMSDAMAIARADLRAKKAATAAREAREAEERTVAEALGHRFDLSGSWGPRWHGATHCADCGLDLLDERIDARCFGEPV